MLGSGLGLGLGQVCSNLNPNPNPNLNPNLRRMNEDNFTNEYSNHVPPTKPLNWFQRRKLEKEEIKVRACTREVVGWLPATPVSTETNSLWKKRFYNFKREHFIIHGPLPPPTTTIKARKAKLKEATLKADYALTHGSLSRLDPTEVDKSLQVKRREKKVEKKEAEGGDGAEGAEGAEGAGAEGAGAAEPAERPAWAEVPDYATATEGDEPRTEATGEGSLEPPLVASVVGDATDAAAEVEATAPAPPLPALSPTTAAGGEGDGGKERGEREGEKPQEASASVANAGAPPFYCDVCAIQTTSLSDFDRHKSSKQHKKRLRGQEEASTAITSSKVSELTAAIEKARYWKAHHKSKKKKKQPKKEVPLPARVPATPTAATTPALPAPGAGRRLVADRRAD